MDKKGFFTLTGLCFLLPMIFLAANFFLIFSNEQKISLLSINNEKAQYLAESSLEKTFAQLCNNPTLYDQIYSAAREQPAVYKKNLLHVDSYNKNHHLVCDVYFQFFNYTNSLFSLTSISKFDNAAKSVTVYIKEDKHIFSILRWDYHNEYNQ
ncbi:hypothetical protein [Pectinatus sottacetonis]|uniref:hypothetical protein n=1 Tax=Pectinatus sottacetonis TaxID=1002795 RepID=UPI0018C4D602|nr:hypothetical protein [Pectinatus sottacetonis]